MSAIDWESAAWQFDAEADMYIRAYARAHNAWVSAYNRAYFQQKRLGFARDLAVDLAVMSA